MDRFKPKRVAGIPFKSPNESVDEVGMKELKDQSETPPVQPVVPLELSRAQMEMEMIDMQHPKDRLMTRV